jgi:hypothetical protein
VSSGSQRELRSNPCRLLREHLSKTPNIRRHENDDDERDADRLAGRSGRQAPDDISVTSFLDEALLNKTNSMRKLAPEVSPFVSKLPVNLHTVTNSIFVI